MQPDWENLWTPGGVAIRLGFRAVILAPSTSLWGPWKLCPLGCYKGHWLLWGLGLPRQGDPAIHQYGSMPLNLSSHCGVWRWRQVLGCWVDHCTTLVRPLQKSCESNVSLGSPQGGAAVVKRSWFLPFLPCRNVSRKEVSCLLLFPPGPGQCLAQSRHTIDTC